MRRGRWDVFILFSFMFFLFCNYALAIPALVVGDIESLPLLTYTSYLEGRPVLFFTEQLSKEEITSLLEKNMSIVFPESNFMDLVLSIAESSSGEEIEEYVEKSKDLIRKSKNDLAYIFNGENSEGLMKRSFSLYKDSSYNLKVNVSRISSKIRTSGLYFAMGEPSEKEKWLLSSLNTDYSLFPSEDFLLYAYFNGDSEEDEFVEIKRDGIEVDLESYPFLKLIYSVNETDVQTIDIIAGMDFTGNGKVDEEVSLREEITSEDWEKSFGISDEFKGFYQFEANLGELLRGRFPAKEQYSLVSLKVQLRKVPGFDSSEREGVYKYYLKSIELFSNSAVIVPVWRSDFEENGLRYESKNVGDYDYLVSSDGGVLINSYFDGESAEEEYVKFDIPVSGYNVDEYPFLDIVYKWDDTSVQDFDFKIGIDFTEDGVVDKEISLRDRREVVLDKWEEIVSKSTVYYYCETRLPLEWPKGYTTQYPSLEKFAVYKNGILMKTTWHKWNDYEELIEIGAGEYNRVAITVPRGTSPEENVYTVSYLPIAGEVKSSADFNELRVNLKEKVREVFPEKESIKIVNLSLYLKKGEGIDCSGDKKGIYTFSIKEIKAYQVSNLSMKDMLEEDESSRAIPLFRIAGKLYSLGDMDEVEIESEGFLGEVKDLHLVKGDYQFSPLENETFKINWFIMEPSNLLSEDSAAKIEFRKVNPTRYVVSGEADESFWLVFSESFHKDWKAYMKKVEIEDDGGISLAEKQRFEWSALITLLKDSGKREELEEHYLVNGYANGWWVPIEADSQAKRFEVILEFTPQRLFEIGIMVSGITFIVCIAYLVYSYLKKKRRKI